jgi:hypothetical protein
MAYEAMFATIMGYAPRLRWLWFRKLMIANLGQPFQIKIEKLVAQMFHFSTMVEIGDGHKTLYWVDRWLDGQSVQELAPCLIRTVGLRIQKRTVKEAMFNRCWVCDIKGTLSL